MKYETAEGALDRALRQAIRDFGLTENEQKKFIYRLATGKLNARDRAVLRQRNKLARAVIH